MKGKMLVMGLLVILLFSVIAMGTEGAGMHKNSDVEKKSITNNSGQIVEIDGVRYTSHDVIRINSNADFTSQNGVVGGSGTKDDPYIISGWDIDAHGDWSGIGISQTTAYFVIKDCYIHNASEGISFYNAENGTVKNVTVSFTGDGIYLESQKDILINNTITNNSYSGIVLNSSKSIDIVGNNITNNGGDGVEIYNGGYIDSSDNRIVDNLISNNGYFGVYLGWGASNNEIYNNSFYYNHGSGDAFNSSFIQARDDGTSNLWNSSNGYGNYWHDWANNNNTNDNDGNGIVDIPYKIAGNANTEDEYALKHATHPMPPLPPTVPLNLKEQSGNRYVNLTWDKPLGEGSSPISEYKIYRNGTLLAVVSNTHLWYNDTGVINGVTYSYYVTAVNAVGESKKSSTVSSTPMTVPDAPQNLQADSGNKYVNLTWSAPVSNGGSEITEYRIYRNGTLLSTVSGDKLWYNDTTVKNGVTYTYTVTAVNSVGESDKSNEVQATPGSNVPELQIFYLPIVALILLLGMLRKRKENILLYSLSSKERDTEKF